MPLIPRNSPGSLCAKGADMGDFNDGFNLAVVFRASGQYGNSPIPVDFS